MGTIIQTGSTSQPDHQGSWWAERFFSWEQILSHFGGSDVSRPILRRVLKKHISSEIKSTVCTVRLVDIPVLQIKTALFGLSE